ncbi:MAG: Smr/MutS family protein [Spirochaetota bacterium]
MADFGRIFEQWESMQRDRRYGRRRGSTDAEPDESSAMRGWMEEQLQRYPIVDKDAQGVDEGENGAGTPLRPEQLPVEDTIDLHGFTLAEALVETEQFVEASLAGGLRKIMIIHGKGRDGEGVLKREVRAYLERHRRIGAMGYAKGPDGGRGALWVLLRTGDRPAG